MARTSAVIGLVSVVIVAVGFAAWRLAIQRVNVVIVNQSGVEALLTWQPSLFAAEVTATVDGCESKSMNLAGGQSWRLEADGLDINDHAVTRPLVARMVEFEIWLDAGAKSRIVGPRQVDRPVPAPNPDSCPGFP